MDPDLADEGRALVFDKLKELIPQQDGFLIELDEWGNRKLAYEIRKKPRGYYIRLDYCGRGALVDEMERFFRIDDRILKYMTVLLDKEVDLESIKTEMAQAQAEAEEKSQTEAAETASGKPDAASTESETSESKANEEA
jgi:small subunit ribosomal protein S6